MSHTIDPGPGYRLLIPGKDVLEDGDELLSIGEWVPTSMAGVPISNALTRSAYRRQIKRYDNISDKFCKWADGRFFYVGSPAALDDIETAFTAGFLAGEANILGKQ